MSSKNFSKKWASQTEIGREYGISAIAVGKLLVGAGLRDARTKQPTKEALARGVAVATPLRDGTQHFMWSREKTKFVFATQVQLSPAQKYANSILRDMKEIDKLLEDGQDKLGYLWLDGLYDEVPKNLRSEVRLLVNEKTQVEEPEPPSVNANRSRLAKGRKRAVALAESQLILLSPGTLVDVAQLVRNDYGDAPWQPVFDELVDKKVITDKGVLTSPDSFCCSCDRTLWAKLTVYQTSIDGKIVCKVCKDQGVCGAWSEKIIEVVV